MKNKKVDFGWRCFKCNRKLPDSWIDSQVEKTGICKACSTTSHSVREAHLLILSLPSGKSTATLEMHDRMGNWVVLGELHDK